MLQNIPIGRDWVKIADASEVFTATFGGANQIEAAPNYLDEPPSGELRGHTLHPERPTSLQMLTREIIGPGHVFVKNTGHASEIICVITKWQSMR
jgi:hypothetical protein